MSAPTQLDPAALEAAAKALMLEAHIGAGPHSLEFAEAFWARDGEYPDWNRAIYTDRATAAITAYIASIEPRLRRAVVELIKAAGDVCDAAEGFAFDPTDEQAVQISEAQDNLDQTEAALLALFGLEAE